MKPPNQPNTNQPATQPTNQPPQPTQTAEANGRVIDVPLHVVFGAEINGAQELRPKKLLMMYLRPLGFW